MTKQASSPIELWQSCNMGVKVVNFGKLFLCQCWLKDLAFMSIGWQINSIKITFQLSASSYHNNSLTLMKKATFNFFQQLQFHQKLFSNLARRRDRTILGGAPDKIAFALL